MHKGVKSVKRSVKRKVKTSRRKSVKKSTKRKVKTSMRKSKASRRKSVKKSGKRKVKTSKRKSLRYGMYSDASSSMTNQGGSRAFIGPIAPWMTRQNDNDSSFVGPIASSSMTTQGGSRPFIGPIAPWMTRQNDNDSSFVGPYRTRYTRLSDSKKDLSTKKLSEYTLDELKKIFILENNNIVGINKKYLYLLDLKDKYTIPAYCSQENVKKYVEKYHSYDISQCKGVSFDTCIDEWKKALNNAKKDIDEDTYLIDIENDENDESDEYYEEDEDYLYKLTTFVYLYDQLKNIVEYRTKVARCFLLDGDINDIYDNYKDKYTIIPLINYAVHSRVINKFNKLLEENEEKYREIDDLRNKLTIKIYGLY